MDNEISTKIEKAGWNIIKSTIIVIFSLGLTIIIFWTLLYSNILANILPIITLRAWYQNAYWKVESLFLKSQRGYPPFKPLYIVQPIRDPLYKYSFVGKYFNSNSKTIELRAYNDRVYTFKLTGQTIDNGNDDLQNMTDTQPNQNLSKASIIVFWDDRRSLSQILDGANKGIPLNDDSNRIYIFVSWF